MNRPLAPSRAHAYALISVGLAISFFTATLCGAWSAATYRLPLSFLYGQSFDWVAICLLASIVLAGLALWKTLQRLITGERLARPLAPLRHAFTVLVLGWLAFLEFAQPFQRLHFEMALGLFGGAWALACLFEVRDAKRTPRILRALDLALFSLCVATVTAESGLRAYAFLQPSPLFVLTGSGPDETIRRFRNKPGEMRFGFPCNSRGYYDQEFFRANQTQDDQLLISIGDSFSVGAVPHALHYTTVLEELTGNTVYNMGVAGIGPPEYASLVALEAAPLKPKGILVSIFIGNDLDVLDVRSEQPDPRLRSWWQSDQVFLFVLPQRLARIRKEGERLVNAGKAQNALPHVVDQDAAAMTAAYPWTADPLLEEASLSEAAFMRLETARALSAYTATPESLELVYRSIQDAKRAAGDIPLYVLLIPDEFQVEDEIWDAVSQQFNQPPQRDRPQTILKAWLRDQKIPYLDLLPVMRAATPLKDGRRHLYHLRDTHWNARGNRLAAESIADFLR
ncbi:MAG: hypothetical protein P8N09_08520 [Planctomycetota bacterium]|nr:hypothetical protein [Planctomycetota bacterium]